MREQTNVNRQCIYGFFFPQENGVAQTRICLKKEIKPNKHINKTKE